MRYQTPIKGLPVINTPIGTILENIYECVDDDTWFNYVFRYNDTNF